MSLLRRARLRWMLPLAMAGLALVPAPRLAAATCAEEVELLAQQYALASGPPRAEPPSGATERPATEESRGVPSGGHIALSDAKRDRMQRLLDAARAADEQGQEAECFQHLSEARAIPEPG